MPYILILITISLNSKTSKLPDASVITSGTFAAARIPNLNASKITAGTLDVDRIPGLAASKITSGTLAAARVPDLNASKITAGTFDAARIPNLNASKITAGTLAWARLGIVAETKEKDNITVNATSSATGSFSVAKSGYTLMAILHTGLSNASATYGGQNVSGCVLYHVSWTSPATINYQIRNNFSATAKVKVFVTLLYRDS